MYKIALAAALATMALAAPAQATITVYTTIASFNAATSAPGTDTFTGLSIIAPTPSPITRMAGPYGYTASSVSSVTGAASTFFGGGTTANPFLSTNNSADRITFSGFTGGATAIGGNFFGSDINGLFTANPAGLTLTATDANGTITQVLLNPTQTSFLGFVSTNAISQLTVVTNTISIFSSVDNLVLAKNANAAPAVPEPASWMMMICGFGIVGAALRRRVTKVSYTAA